MSGIIPKSSSSIHTQFQMCSNYNIIHHHSLSSSFTLSKQGCRECHIRRSFVQSNVSISNLVLALALEFLSPISLSGLLCSLASSTDALISYSPLDSAVIPIDISNDSFGASSGSVCCKVPFHTNFFARSSDMLCAWLRSEGWIRSNECTGSDALFVTRILSSEN